jgi:hypothetical protein
LDRRIATPPVTPSPAFFLDQPEDLGGGGDVGAEAVDGGDAAALRRS